MFKPGDKVLLVDNTFDMKIQHGNRITLKKCNVPPYELEFNKIYVVKAVHNLTTKPTIDETYYPERFKSAEPELFHDQLIKIIKKGKK